MILITLVLYFPLKDFFLLWVCFLFLCPPLKKDGTYYFALVDQSLNWSLKQVLSAQYLLTPLLEVPYWVKGQGQTVGVHYKWYISLIFKYSLALYLLNLIQRGLICSHMVRGQGRTAGLKCCLHNICLIVTKLCTVIGTVKKILIINFRAWSRSRSINRIIHSMAY